ncbi:1458_t:CDS:2 [Funneliformis mosseae]|uniref:1458_t:CDS:1 n=1 Tax=Funneliformis mosseae TaxID=27381 RepID=A0A9N9DMG9_FUNMO|nr:1458_t:CDS:2 [Funneliformis mosseae]
MFVTKSFKRLQPGGGCISNTLSNGYVALYSTKVDFFNRKRELVNFRNAFSGDPQLHVVLGPPSSGKTALVRQITSKDKLFNPLFINCRKGQFDTPARVYDSIYSQFHPFFDKYKDSLKQVVGGTLNAGYTGLSVGYEVGGASATTSNDVTRLLDNINTYLPNWTFWNGHNIPPPILIIDEANMFSQLAKNDGTLLKSILNWLVLNTKEEERFHAVLTSSDSFFFNWIENLLHIPHATPYVVGDLSKEEAEEYFEKRVLPKHECKELEGKFDHVRKITGTRMLIIDRYVKEYQNFKGKLAVSDFSVYGSEYSKLKAGLHPNKLKYSDKPNLPLWKDSDLIKTMKAIVEAENQGYILEDDLINEIGSEQVDSLVDYNFLHCRPVSTSKYANDINPPDKIILTAMNQPSVRAMEQILSEVNSNKK